MDILIPAAGPSDTKPRYLCYDYKGEMFLKTVVGPYLGHNIIHVGISQAHETQWQASEFIKNELPDVKIIVLDKKTEGPADTVYHMLMQAENIQFDSPIFIHDSDTMFTHSMREDNSICVSRVVNNKTMKNVSSKSFVEMNNENIISDISEENIISGVFSVGGYTFNESQLFMDYYELIQSTSNGPTYISHVINEAIMGDEQFLTEDAQNYIDFSSDDDWKEYNDKPDIFCDVDGTIIVAQHRWGAYSYGSPPLVLHDNVQRLIELQAKGSHIIFTCARPPETADITRDMLTKLGFKDFALICGMNNSRRVLINDFDENNRFPRAIAVNLKRNMDGLRDYL